MKMKLKTKKQKNMENQNENCESLSLRLSQIHREALLQVNTQMIVTSETIQHLRNKVFITIELNKLICTQAINTVERRVLEHLNYADQVLLTPSALVVPTKNLAI